MIVTSFPIAGFRWLRRLRYSGQVTSEDGPNGNRTLARAAALLDAFVSTSELTAAELAEQTGLSRSTAHRLASAMVEYGFLERTSRGSFALGPRLSSTPLERLAVGVLEQLCLHTQEAAQLWVRRGTGCVCAVSVSSSQELRVVVPVGTYVSTSEASVGQLLSGVPAVLELAAEQGWVESTTGEGSGVSTLTAPVYRRGLVIAAVRVTVPSGRVVLSIGEDFGYEVASAAGILSDGTEA